MSGAALASACASYGVSQIHLSHKKGAYRMKTFEIQFSYQDRDKGKVEAKLQVDASSLPGGVAKATREFVKSLDRKQRFDMNKNGLEITAKPFAANSESQPKLSAESAAG
jgi:polyisoprenoid-binding protein YceI